MLRLQVKRVALYSCKGTELWEKCFYLLVGKCYHFCFYPPILYNIQYPLFIFLHDDFNSPYINHGIEYADVLGL